MSWWMWALVAWVGGAVVFLITLWILGLVYDRSIDREMAKGADEDLTIAERTSRLGWEENDDLSL